MKFVRITAIMTLITALCFAFSSCSQIKTKSSSQSDVIMGSVVTVKTYCASDESNAQLQQEILGRIRQLDSLISKNDENAVLCQINRGLPYSDKDIHELIKYLKSTVDIYSVSGGKLAVTSGALTELWGFDNGEFRKPDRDEIQNAVSLCDDSKLILDTDSNTVSFADGQVLNLGSVGKGIACDKAGERLMLTSQFCEGAVISVGGSVGVFGTHDGKDVWNVGIRDPFGSENDYFAVLSVKGNSFISTSGNYEKFFEYEGQTYHHILDLTTGYPADSGLVSVTVKADTGLLSDALSTMCFVLGREKSDGILKSYGADAVFVYTDKSVEVTEGLEESLSIKNGEYTLK